MTLDALEKVLTHPNIILLPVTGTPGKLNRDRSFVLYGMLYRIEWWVNLIYLHHGGAMVVADSVEQSGTWPNSAPLNLQFSYQGSVVCVVELEQGRRDS